MDLELTDDQELFSETTAKFIENTCPLSTVREWAEKEPAGYPGDWWRQGAELGWTSLLVSEEDGGGSVSGHGLLDLTLVAEVMGHWVSPGPLLPTNVVAAALSEFGTPAQKERYLPGLLSGESTATWCLAETRQSGLPGGVSLTATRQGGSFVLSGKKGPAEAAGEAGFFVVAALVDGEVTQFVVDADTPGVSVVAAESIDLVRRFATVSFDDVVLTADAVLGEVGGAAAQIERLFELAVALQCASMAGVTDHVLAFTLAYSFDRYSFGRPLASYQALKHRFADMKMWTEACLGTAAACGTIGGQPVGEGVRARQRGQVVHRGQGAGDPAGLRAAPRWHRRHLGPRPASLHQAGRTGSLVVRHSLRSSGTHRAGARTGG